MSPLEGQRTTLRSNPAILKSVAAADAETAIKAFKPGKNFGEFIAKGKDGEFTLMPLFNIYHEHYSAYLPLNK